MASVPHNAAQTLRHLSRRLGSDAEARWLLQAFHKPSSSSANALAAKSSSANERTASISAHTRARLARAVYERMSLHKPLQLILGTQPFLTHDIRVAQGVLIPRPETEEWVARLLSFPSLCADPMFSESPEPIRILDLGCGSGCIGLTLADALTRESNQSTDPIPARVPKSVQLTMVDYSKRAIQLSFINALRMRSRGVHIVQSNWFAALAGDLVGGSSQLVDLIVSNPPYLTMHDYKTASRDVRHWEDSAALIGGGHRGAASVVSILRHAKTFLKPGGRLLIELDGSDEQAEFVTRWACRLHYRDVDVWNDFSERRRVLYAVMPPSSKR